MHHLTSSGPSTPDARSTKIGRILFLVLAILNIVWFGGTSILLLAYPLVSGSGSSVLWAFGVVILVMLQTVGLHLAVLRDRRVGDTTGGLGLTYFVELMLNLVLFLFLGGLAFLY